jgi:hypothetical protein
MPSPAFTNTSISNAYRGADRVSKILLGHNHVWPLAPIFSFDTYQTGGELNFDVASDTGIIATVINGNESMLHPSLQSINLIQAKSDTNSYNDTYTTPPGTQLTNINLPLYSRREVNITGRGTQVTRYNADYNNGSVNVTISNDFSEAVTFSVNLNGNTKTVNIAGKSAGIISFTALSRGSKLITITNVTDNTSEQISVTINTNYTPLTPIYYRFGAQDNPKSTSSKLTRVDVYALTEAEALASNSSFTAKSRPVKLVAKNWIWDLQRVNSRLFRLTIGHTIEIVDRGIGYAKNSSMQTKAVVDTGDLWSGSKPFVGDIDFKTNNKGEVIEYRVYSLRQSNATYLWSDWSLSTIPITLTVIIPGGAARGDYPPYDTVFNITGVPIPPAVTSVPAENLIFNNIDSQGSLVSVNMDGIAVNSITAQSQKDLQIIQTSSTNTYPDIKSSAPSMLNSSASPELKALHGADITYQYYTGSWPNQFDPLLYRQSYPNTIGAAYSSSDLEGLWYHYKTWGAEQGFTHSADFLAQDYLDLNPDLQVAFGSDPSPRTSAMLHWFEYGIAEGRQGRK